MTIIITILASLLVFGAVIAIHEFGHFAAAKLSGIQVNEFSIGMGPALWKKIAGGTQYTLRLLPVGGYVAMEAEHFFAQTGAAGAAWTKIPYVGRTLSGMALMPYTAATDGASLSYRMQIPADVKEVTVHVIVKSTLAFHNPEGHRYGIGFKGGEETVINFNGNLNEKPENVYSVYYPTVARRVIEKKVDLTLPAAENGMQTLVFRPIEPGTVLEKIVVDYGGYKPSYLFMKESPCKKQ